MNKEQINVLKQILVKLQDFCYASFNAEDMAALDMADACAVNIRDFLKKRNEGVKSPPRAKLEVVKD